MGKSNSKSINTVSIDDTDDDYHRLKALKQNKINDYGIACSASLLATSVGVGFMVMGGWVGYVVGSTLIGAGVTGGISATQQRYNKKQEKIDFKKWAIQISIGAAGGAISSPISFAGGAIAGASGTVAGVTTCRVCIIVGADLTAGVMAGASTKVLNNAYEGKHLSDGVLTNAMIGALTGGIAGGASCGTNMIL